MVEAWVFAENLRPFLTAVGWVVGYGMDADDWEAIAHGFRESDAEHGRWYEYEFWGVQRAALAVAIDCQGGSVAGVRVQVPAEAVERVRLLALFCGHFRWVQS